MKVSSDPSSSSYIDTRILEADLTNTLYHIRRVLLSLLPVYEDIYLLNMSKGKHSISCTSTSTVNKSSSSSSSSSSNSGSSSSSNGAGRAGDSKVEYKSRLCISEYAMYILDNMLSRYTSNNSSNSSGNSGTSSSSPRQSYNSNNYSNNKTSHISAVVPTSSSSSMSCELFIAITGTLCFLSYIQHQQHHHQKTSSPLSPVVVGTPSITAHTNTTVAPTQICTLNSTTSDSSNSSPDDTSYINLYSSRPDFLLSLDPGTKLAYLANHLISLLEKAPYQRYDISILILQLLLSMPIPYLSHRRGKWYTRLCIDLEHLITITPSPQSHVSISYCKYIHSHPSSSTTTTTGANTSESTGNRNSQYNNISTSSGSSSSSNSSGGGVTGVTDSLRLASYAFCRMALSDPLVRVSYII